MSSLHFVVSIGEGDQLNDRIREVADKINKYGTQTFPALQSLKSPVKQVVVGPAYLGVLLEDGKAFRVAFSVIPERLDLSKHDSSTKNSGTPAGNGTPGAGGNTGTAGGAGAGSGGQGTSKHSATARQLTRSTRARIMRTSSGSVRGGGSSGQASRSTGVIIGGTTSGRSLVTVPATFVPEELISQAQVVLQGKSRNLIIRELQRTNLDVNLAVNNLLSRDDEEGEDTEEGSDNYVPEDLISLLDSGFHSDNSVIIDADAMFSEEMFGYSNIRNLMLHSRSRGERLQTTSAPAANPTESTSVRTSSGTSSVSAVVNSAGATGANLTSTTANADREAFGRWRDRQYFGPRRWFQTARDEVQWEKEQESRNKKDMSSGFPLWVSDDLEWWPEREHNTRFTQIASLYSEFIAISTKGELHQWKWSDREPYRNNDFPNIYHPKTQSLYLIYEKVMHVSATTIRCSVSTESGKIATWMDELLGYAGNKLEHTATNYPEFALDKIISLHTCSLYTVARTESGELFWWGVLPFTQRKKIWDKYRAKSKKPQRKEKEKDSAASEVTVGAQVCMKNCPMYQPGAIGFCVSNGVPKVGQLLNAAWDLMNICRFKILPIPAIPTAATSSSAASSSVSAATLELKESLGKLSATIGVANAASGGGSSNASNQTASSPAKAPANVGNKETADRLDMPPPPSPASSTCSDTGSVSNKRQKRMTPKEDLDNKKDEEIWNLKDVVFVEDVRSAPVGRVLKVDGQFAAVRFPSATAAKDKFDESSADAWQDCRLLRKDDLQVIKSTATSRVPDCIQKIPRRIVLNIQLNEHSQLLTLAIDSKGIHAVMKTGNKLHYALFNLNTGRMDKNFIFPTDLNSFMGKLPQNISLTCAGDQAESILILRDGNKTIYPLAKDCADAIRDPSWMDLPPLNCVAATPLTLPSNSANVRSQVTLVVLATELQQMMPRIMRCDIEAVKHLLGQLAGDLKTQIPSIIQEYTDGNRNIVHACVTQCSPTSNKDSEQDLLAANTAGAGSNNGGLECINAIANSIISNRSANIREIMRRATPSSVLAGDSHHLSSGGAADDNSMPLSYWPNEYEAGNSGDEDSLSGIHMTKMSHQQSLLHQHSQPQENYISDPTERRLNALFCVQMLCESSALQPHLRQLLSSRDAQGYTPFMLAVTSRAYQAGIVLFEAILKIANGDAQIRDSMVFPNGSSADQSPLHVICCNDTCSFTWTGADHINQDIFECQTCGLTGSLCCCTECAKVCHKGHDCKLKRTSPTAYCDCWEKCKCKALIAGNQTKRFELLEKLIKDTDLVTRFNSRSESILLFLIQTVGRQSIEQRQYRSTARVQQRSSTGSSGNRKTPSLDTDADLPGHDLEPPQFARKALERLLGDWAAVKAMIQTGAENEIDLNSMSSQVFYEDSENKNLYIQSQSGTIMLDKFTHILFFRCNNEPLDTLLATLVNELQNEGVTGRTDEAQKVARRFVRSVARVFVIFSIEKSNNPDKQRNSTLQARLTLAYRRVFTSLLKFAIEELVEIADALIAPVRLGVVRPTAPFQLTSNSLDADDLFSVEPLAPPTARQNNSLVDDASTSQLETESNASRFLVRITSALRNDLEDINDPDAMVQDDGDISEQDEPQSAVSARQNNNNNNVVDDGNDDPMGQDGGQEAESDNEFNFHEAETESDSDDNQSTQDAQRSVQTGATAGSDTGLSNFLLNNEDDSGDSSQPDDDGSDDAESDEHSQEDFVLADEQLERRPATSGHQRNNLAPQSMQWAIRSRDTTRSTNLHRLAGGSNLVFIDPNALRRSTAASAVAAAQEAPTMATTSSALARAFGIVLRQISELVGMLAWKFACPTSSTYQNYDITYQEAVQLQMYVEKRLKPTWDWILTVMDATEAQLRFGASLTDSADPAHPLHPLNVPSTSATTSTVNTTTNTGPPLQARPNRTATIHTLTTNTTNPSSFNSGSRTRDRNGTADSATSRRDFLTYCLSLMRSHNSEHRDSLPVLDVTALRHIAYVLDAVIFYMRASNELDGERNDSNAWDDQDENENEDVDDEFATSLVMDTDSIDDSDMLIRPSLGRRHGFFQRSESTLCLGCPPPDAFNTPMAEALPLADQPHLLQPNARREDLFGMPKQAITVPAGSEPSGSSLELPPIRLGLSSQTKHEMLQSSNNVVIVTPAPQIAQTETTETVDDTQKQITRNKDTQEQVVTITHKRPLSPKAGSSKQQQSQGMHETYYKKSTRPFFISNSSNSNTHNNSGSRTTRKNYNDYEDEESGDDEPQDLSQTMKNNSNTSSKMDIDDNTSSSSASHHQQPQVTVKVLKSDENLFEESDCDDTEDETDEAVIRSPVHKKHRLMESDQASAAAKTIIRSGGGNIGETSITPALMDHQLQDSMDANLDPSVRPPIIVTRRNVADAIQAVTATVLSKNKKTSLSECVAPETPLTFLPQNFNYDGEQEQSKSSGEQEQSSSSGSQGACSSKSVIVRVGTATVSHLDQQILETMDENQDVSANVTIETSSVPGPPQVLQELPPRGVYFRSNVTSDLLLGRWRLSLILFGRVFLEDVGMEPGSIISELGGFPVKEAKFRRHMEKLRHGQQRDLTLSKIDRARSCLIPQTFKELNTQYNNNNRRIQPPLTFNRVKVTFKDEPGEGSGVARSFYTLIAESLLSRENLPNLESAQVGASKYTVPFSTMIRQRSISSAGHLPSSLAVPMNNSSSGAGSGSARAGNESVRRLSTKRTLWRNRDNRKMLLNFDSRPFRPASESGLNNASAGPNEHLSGHQQQLGERLYSKVYQIHATQAPKITGMLLDLPPTQWIILLSSDETLRQKANEAMEIISFRHRLDMENNLNNLSSSGSNNIMAGVQIPPPPVISSISISNSVLNPNGNTSTSATLNIVSELAAQQAAAASPQTKKLNPIVVLEDCQLDDNAPLFYTPGKPNVYSPRQGYPSFERINAFRNVGRLIGLCLLQNELLPIFLQRHVLKYILGRQVRFHDLAFFDPIVYESLRQLVKDSQMKNGAQVLQSLELNFVIDLGPEEGGGSVELVQNGRDIIVNEQNVYDYVRKYAEYRMIKTQEKALEALRSGVFDVLPETALDTLTSEDLRLLLNGVGDINVSVLSNYTSFNDESNESADKLQRFKRWLWQIVERMTNLERQDLIYFWTGSPALPASEEGFQPMPTVTIRPADDAHLPTANTCISRLYIPLYSSKAVLRHKLLLAIKTKNFGFV